MGQLIPLDSFGVTEHDVLEALGRVKVRDVATVPVAPPLGKAA